MPFIINPNIKDICSSAYIVLALITLYHGISLNYKHFSVRKFIAASSMVNLGLIVASMITWDLGLALQLLISYIILFLWCYSRRRRKFLAFPLQISCFYNKKHTFIIEFLSPKYWKFRHWAQFCLKKLKKTRRFAAKNLKNNSQKS